MSKLSSLKLKNITSRNMTIVLQQIVLFFLIYLQYSKKMVRYEFFCFENWSKICWCLCKILSADKLCIVQAYISVMMLLKHFFTQNITDFREY